MVACSFRRVPYTHGGRSLSVVAPKRITSGPEAYECILSPPAPGHAIDGPQ
ncbi:hypothetical protein GCM10027580_20690 [Corynebacterium faecale]